MRFHYFKPPSGKARRYRGLGIPSLFIVGCGFLITLFLAFFMLNYPLYESYIRELTFGELKQKYPVIRSDKTYHFVNQVILEESGEKADSSNAPYIEAKSVPFNTNRVERVLEKLAGKAITNLQKEQLASQLNEAYYLWHPQKLNAVYLTPQKRHRIKEAAGRNTSDAQTHYLREEGPFISLSKPVFSKDDAIVVIQVITLGGPLMGRHNILVFKQQDESYELIHKDNIWVS